MIPGTVALFIAHDVMVAQTPAFAPFSAVLIMQVTVYQSLLQALRYGAAVCVGVFIQAGPGFLAGPDLLTFVLVALVALTISRWRRLGAQGVQVATAAFFAFSTYTVSTGNLERVEQLSQILALVGIGSGIGVLTNLTVLPPIRYRSAETGIRALARSLCGLLADVASVLREGEPDSEYTADWRRRAADLGTTVSNSRSALLTAWESRHYNPRRHLPGGLRNQDFSGYQAIFDALERVTFQVASMTRTLHHWPPDEDGEECRRFLAGYADLLEALGRIIRQFSEIDTKRLARQAGGRGVRLCRKRTGHAQAADRIQPGDQSAAGRPHAALRHPPRRSHSAHGRGPALLRCPPPLLR
ncbi:hypothetical protein [Streptomyces axinellae]|uniref:FUSC family protein n=1 Tax=Streptomyces axinellae TaxID=552788 RepID=A0ABN3Q6E5_9ACTN